MFDNLSKAFIKDRIIGEYYFEEDKSTGKRFR